MVKLPKGSGGFREGSGGSREGPWQVPRGTQRLPRGTLAGPESLRGLRRVPRGFREAPERDLGRSREAHRDSREAPSQAVAPTKAHFIHEMGLICGQAAAISSPHPQKIPYLWTKAHSRHQTSTKSTFCVDKSCLRAPNFHKKHLLRGQAAAISSPHPQKIPFLWTKVPSQHQTSTKMHPPVDKSPLRAPNFHKKYHLRGQAVAIPSPHPQKIPFLWTKAHSEHQTSTKSTSCVDRRLLFPLRIHKRYPICGQKSPLSTKLPQKVPPAWTGGCYSLSASTKDTLFVDEGPLPAPNFHKNAPACGQKSPPSTKLPQKVPSAWTGGNYFFPETQPGVRLLVGKRESRTTSSSLSTLLSCLLVAL